MRRGLRAVLALVCVTLASTLWITSGSSAPAAEATATRSPGYAESPYQLWPIEVVSPDGMVVSGSEEASRAGARILAAGGNAIDAAVTAALVLGVTEPMTSGLGGQTFILIYLEDGRTATIDGSCRVPGHVRPAELQKARAAAERQYISGYGSVAVPGSLAALALALERYGTITLAEALAPAIEAAEYGFRLSSTGASEVEIVAPWLRQQDYAASLFLKDFTGTWGPDHLYCAADLATTLRRIAASGPDEFYRGRIADEIEADMKRNGGYLRKADLATLRAAEGRPLRDGYRGLDVLCFPAPGGGGSLLEMLHILESFPQQLLERDSLERLHLLIEAARIVKIDSQASRLPTAIRDSHLKDRRLAAERAGLIRFDRALLPAEISREAPPPYLALGTTQVSVADRYGNVVALAQTLGAFFGADVATPGLGFLYNSNLNAFDFVNPRSPHFVVPGRAPMTTMTPAILLKDGKPFLVLGSAGSDRIVPSMAAVISGVADRGLGPCEAVACPRALWGASWGDPKPWVELAGEITEDRARALEERGFANLFRLEFPARWFDLSIFGGTNVVVVDPRSGSFVGVPDPRRQGSAAAPSRR